MSTNKSDLEESLHALPDYIKENLDMIVVGLNPSLTSAQIGHYFAGPGNHFWSCVSEVGLVSEPVTCYDDSRLLDYGIGFTNACTRATKGAADLSKKELKDGMKLLLAKLQKYMPKIVVFNGKGTYEIFVRHKHFGMGKQPQRLEGTNSVVFVMPSSSARCAQLPRASDKIPFFAALKELRDRIKIWSNGLNTGGRLVPLEETLNSTLFPDQIDLELTRLYDAGKSNYSTDRAEKKRKASEVNGDSHRNVKTSSSENSSQGSGPGNPRSQQLSKKNHYPPVKEERDPGAPGSNHHGIMPPLAPNMCNNNGQWVAGSFYNSSFSYQQYLMDSSAAQYSPQNYGRLPSYRSNYLPISLPPPMAKSYSNGMTNGNPISNSKERIDNSLNNISVNGNNECNRYQNIGKDPLDKAEHVKTDAKENLNSQQWSTNFISLLMSDSGSVPGSPSEFESTTDNRSLSNDNCIPTQCHPASSFWEPNNNLLGPRRLLPLEQPMASMFTSFQSNLTTNYDDIAPSNQYQSPFSSSYLQYSNPPTSHCGGSLNSPLSSDQVTSSLCSTKVTPDSTSLASQKRSFHGPDHGVSIPNKVTVTDGLCSQSYDHVSLTYTDL